MKVLITGDSHTAALKGGQNLLISKGMWPQQVDLTIRPLGNGKFFTTPFFTDKGDYAEICNPEYRKQFIRFPPAEMESSDVIYGLSGLFHTGGLRRHQTWTEFSPFHIANQEYPVSNALLRQVIRDKTQYLLKFVDIILQNQKKLFVIEAPKPFRHTKSVNPIRTEVISYVDHYYRDFVKQELRLRNVPIITVSPECHDEAGFMLERYRSPKENDMHHGNAEFGQLMMKKILKFLI